MHVGKFDIKEARLKQAEIEMTQCEVCRGRGIDPNTTPSMGIPCAACNGTGEKQLNINALTLEDMLEDLVIPAKPEPVKPEPEKKELVKSEPAKKENK